MAKPPTKKPSPRSEEIRKTRAMETAKANMASRAADTAKSKTAKALVKKYGAKAFGAAGTAWQVSDVINEFRSAKTGAAKAKATANLMQSAHPIGWIGGPVIEELQNTASYQKAQTKALDWYDSVSPSKKLNDLASDAKAKAGAAAAAKRRAAMAKTSPKGKK